MQAMDLASSVTMPIIKKYLAEITQYKPKTCTESEKQYDKNIVQYIVALPKDTIQNHFP